MFIPKFYHLSGIDLWQRCDFDKLQINVPQQSVELATIEQQDKKPAISIDKQDNIDTLIQRKGAAIQMLYHLDLVDDSLILLADPQQDVLKLANDGWTSLRPKVAKQPRSATCFSSTTFSNTTETLFQAPKTLAPDPYGRLWLLELGSHKIRALDAQNMRIITTLIPPDITLTERASGIGSPASMLLSNITDLAATSWGLVICDRKNRQLWQQLYGGEWLNITGRVSELIKDQGEHECIALTGHPRSDAIAILRPINSNTARSKIIYIHKDAVKQLKITDFEDPLYLLLSDKDTLFIAESGKESEKSSIHRFTSYSLDLSNIEKEQKTIQHHKIHNWILRYFDGRAIYADQSGKVFGTTEQRVYPLSRTNTQRVTQGQIETYALDSEKIACQWHRVFIDACLPIGTNIEVSARVSDVLPDFRIRRDPRSAYGASPLPKNNEESVENAWNNLPLGSINADDKQDWLSLGVLDKRPYQADIPLSPEGNQLSSDDKYQQDRSTLANDANNLSIDLQTLEGLIKNAKGRYLWLRVTLKGDGKYSPSVQAIRASFNRPSLLDHLPAYWQAEPEVAQQTDHVLSLFEGQYTELSQRVAEFKQLLDPSICPPEALPWLASFIDLSFDTRISEPVRRQLLQEMTALYRQKGTLNGLERLCEILTGRKIAIVEKFRLRRRSLTILGQPPQNADVSTGAILGEGMQLGVAGKKIKGSEPANVLDDYPTTEKWEKELLQAHRKVLESSKASCPKEKIPEPFPKDPALAFYRTYAHRFHVIVFGTKNNEIEAVIEEAIEANKPAHTSHDICWLESGFRVGKNTYLGLGTVIADENRLRPAILGKQVLGASTLSHQQTVSRGDTCKPILISVGSSRLGVTP